MSIICFVFFAALYIGIAIIFIQAQKEDIAEMNHRDSQGRRKLNKYDPQAAEDQKFWEALIVLDAAEQGFFWPGGERVFEALDKPEMESYRYSDDWQDYDDYDDDYDDDRNDCEEYE